MTALLTVLVALACLAVAALDVPELRRQRRARPMVVYGVLWALALTAAVAQAQRVPLPSLNQLVTRIVAPAQGGR